jgi:hypothetical protein
MDNSGRVLSLHGVRCYTAGDWMIMGRWPWVLFFREKKNRTQIE